mmetsp:Transcript_3471/g.7399  ORF Transcript_3471/g.7399 Transcript_3471/m.7399 type:complete len:282 (+) Transcript_3471:602-1447(+)
MVGPIDGDVLLQHELVDRLLVPVRQLRQWLAPGVVLDRLNPGFEHRAKRLVRAAAQVERADVERDLACIRMLEVEVLAAPRVARDAVRRHLERRARVVIECSVGGEQEVDSRVRLLDGAKVWPRVSEPRNVRVGDEHVVAAPQQRRHLRPPAGLAINLKELPARTEECRVGRVHLLLQRWTQVRRDADERAETHGLQLPRPIQRKICSFKICKCCDDSVSIRRSSQLVLVQIELAITRPTHGVAISTKKAAQPGALGASTMRCCAMSSTVRPLETLPFCMP